MKTWLLCGLFCGIIVAAVGCGSAASSTATPQVVGGMSPADAADAGVKAAADFAVVALAKQAGGTLVLRKILAANQQIVAGTNYDLTLQVAASDGASRVAKVVVWRKLDGTFELTRSDWTK